MDQKEGSKRIFSREQAEAFLDLLEEIPPPPLHRNDPCLCGSGLKYKKCCLTKNKIPTLSTIRLESFAIKSDALTPEEVQNTFPAVSPEDEEVMATLQHNLHEHPDTIDSENCEYFQKLNALQAKYPDHPMILNYLSAGYNHLGQQDRLEECVAKTYAKFPDYLFAKTAQTDIYLRKGLPEKVLEVFQGAYTLKQLYPHRTVFHLSEVRAFEHVMVRYFCEIQNLEQASIHLQVMQDILEKDDPFLQDMQTLVKRSKALNNLKAHLSYLLKAANFFKETS